MDEIVTGSLEARKHLVAARFSELQANSIVDTVYGSRKGLATKTDIREMKTDIREIRLNFCNVRRDIRELRGAVDRMATRQDLADLRLEFTGLRQEMADLKDELKQKMADQKDEMKQDARDQRMTDRWMFAILWTLMVASNALVFHFMG